MTEKNKLSFGKKLLIILLVSILLVIVGFYFNGITGNVALANYSDTNYSAPYNLSNPDDFIFKISSDSLVAVEDLVNLTANVSIEGGYIYQKGYVFNQLTHSWEVFNFDESPIENSYWIRDFASKDLIINVSNRIVNNSETYIVAYVCLVDSSGNWRCGCQSESETNCKRWSLHKFVITNITISPDIQCTDNANCSMTNGTCVEGLCVSEGVVNFPLGTPENPFSINTCEELQNISWNMSFARNLNASYKLLNDINCINTSVPGASIWDGEGFSPLGNGGVWSGILNNFSGTFNGNGKIIYNLFINRPLLSYVGLFGHSIGNITDVKLVNCNVTGSSSVGIGILAGRNDGIIENSYSIGNITGKTNVGGLVGDNLGSIFGSYSQVSVRGTWIQSGGLVGGNSGIINNSYSIGNITGNSWVGGFSGLNYGSLYNSYSIGNITGNRFVGGFSGMNDGSVYNSYSTGKVAGNQYRGGLLGGVTSSNAYNSFWDNETSGMSTSVGGGEGKITLDMKNPDTFSVWDASIWNLTEGQYPQLKWQFF
jgi:hypothetical protein